MKKSKTKHPLVVPPDDETLIELYYLADTGRWRKLKGQPEPALAYIGKEQTRVKGSLYFNNYAWVADCNCKIHSECPASRALDKACDLWDGASLVRIPVRPR